MTEWVLDKDRVIHSIKTAFACLIGFIITKSMHLPVDQWLIITILVVMCAQINVGSMILKSYMRFLGTLSGSIVAALTIWLLGTQPSTIGLVLVLAALCFSYIATNPATISESGTLGVVTTAIILISPNPTLMTAAGRCLEITAGIIIAALVSQFILPIHARTILRRKQTQTVHQLRAYYHATLLMNQEESKYNEIDESIVKSLIVQRKLSIDAGKEPFSKNAFIVKQFYKLLWCEREILRAVTFMHHTFKSSTECKTIFTNAKMMNEFHDKISLVFDKIAAHIGKKRKAPIEIDIPSIQIIKDTVHAENRLTENDLIYTNTFLFCADTLVERLKDLVNLIK